MQTQVAAALRTAVQERIVIPTLPAQEHSGMFTFDENELCVYMCVCDHPSNACMHCT